MLSTMTDGSVKVQTGDFRLSSDGDLMGNITDLGWKRGKWPTTVVVTDAIKEPGMEARLRLLKKVRAEIITDDLLAEIAAIERALSVEFRLWHTGEHVLTYRADNLDLMQVFF